MDLIRRRSLQIGAQTVQARIAAPLRDFIATENSSAVILLGATVAALVWANSPWSESYERVWRTTLAIRFGGGELSLDLRHWINDGLMALFFFAAGLEIRREFDMGELRDRRRVATPVIAALGGVAVPALLYLAVNAGEATARGWGIPMGTDTAFALGILALVGGRFTPRVRIFLLTLVIIDDIAALTVIAVAYTEDLSITAFVTAISLLFLVIVFKRLGVRGGMAYALAGVGVWLATLISGVHATVAGVALGVLASAHPPSQEDLDRAGARWRLFREQPTPDLAHRASLSISGSISSNERLQHLLHPWTSYLIVPVFALANAGGEINAGVISHAVSSPVTLGIVAGLVAGKPLGIMAATWLGTRRCLGGWPLPVPWPALFGAATLAGVGFTVSLLIADISFAGDDLEDAKLGILAGSVISAVLAAIAFRAIALLPRRAFQSGASTRPAPPVDLSDPVDPALDHIRGSEEAPVTLVEYGDFECRFCGQAEPAIRDLAQAVGEDLRFVFRHLPLTVVHTHAQLAAEAAEAAAAQGRFWEMHDVLLADQHALDIDELQKQAERLGLDVEQFTKDLASRRYTLRVARDVEGAAMSGVAGTPTFFINGRRHNGAYDLASLVDAIRQEAARVRGR